MCHIPYTNSECETRFSPGPYTHPHLGWKPSPKCEKLFRIYAPFQDCGKSTCAVRRGEAKPAMVNVTKTTANAWTGVITEEKGIDFCDTCQSYNEGKRWRQVEQIEVSEKVRIGVSEEVEMHGG